MPYNYPQTQPSQPSKNRINLIKFKLRDLTKI